MHNISVLLLMLSRCFFFPPPFSKEFLLCLYWIVAFLVSCSAICWVSFKLYAYALDCCGNLYIISFFRSTEDSNVLLVNDFQDRLQVCNRLMLLVYLPVVANGLGIETKSTSCRFLAIVFCTILFAPPVNLTFGAYKVELT